MKVHIVFGIFKGVIDDVRAFEDKEKANEEEKRLCGEYEVPYDAKKRQDYYSNGGENEVRHFIVDLE